MADTKKDEIICPPEPSVFVWSAAFYQISSKKWIHGELQVTPSTLCFYDHLGNTTDISTPEKQSKSLLHLLKLDDIAEIKKASSSYVFKCIVVLMRNGDEHWFGSFPGRDGAYNALEHFWKERLLGRTRSKSPSRRGDQTQLGQELLAVTQDSVNTLQETGATLQKQGEQLNFAHSVMHDLHNDLDVAEHLTSSLESWFSHWGMPHPTHDPEPIEFIDADGVTIFHNFPILYHEGRTHQTQSLLTKVHLSPKRGPPINEQTGTLMLSKEGATISDSGNRQVYHYNPSDISVVSVTSPWKMAIVKYNIGEPDTVYKVTSTQLMPLLRVFHSIVHNKIQYESPLEEPVIPQSLGIPGAPMQATQLQHSDNVEVLVHAEGSSQKNTISETEARELSDMISGMKSVAVGIQVEQDRQMETIDNLEDSVDKANIRLKDQTKRVNKMI